MDNMKDMMIMNFIHSIARSLGNIVLVYPIFVYYVFSCSLEQDFPNQDSEFVS